VIALILELMDNIIIFGVRMRAIRKKEGFEGQRAIILPKKILYAQCETNPVIRGAYITDIGYYPKAKYHYRKRPHGVDQNILIYCVEGSGSAQVGECAYKIDAGNFILIPANTPHFYASNNECAWTIYWLHFKGEMGDAITESIVAQLDGHKGLIAFNEKRESLFEELYSNLERGYSNDNILYANMCLWHLMASFQFDRKFDNTDSWKDHDVVSSAIDFMQQHINNALTLSQIAHNANLSISHFAAVFHKKTGFSPIEYFNHLKVQKACQYLQFTENRMKEIASCLGIEDCYYFSRLFKKVMGMSPVEYRKKFRK
jgi:AraC-like DNA-binding protein/mannose-6-phosphate isomerase-like protein (cupin superfamily)